MIVFITLPLNSYLAACKKLQIAGEKAVFYKFAWLFFDEFFDALVCKHD